LWCTCYRDRFEGPNYTESWPPRYLSFLRPCVILLLHYSMTITVKQETVPRHLLPAILYLDDIEEIISIAVEMGQPSDSPTPDARSVVTFELGNQVCDQISDLEKIGGVVSNLEVRWESGSASFFRLSIDRTSATWDFYGVNEEDDWKVYRRLKALFELRKRRWRARFEGLEAWVIASIVVMVSVFAAAVVSSVTKKTIELKPPPGYVWEIIILLSLLMVFLIFRNHTIVQLSRRPARGTWADVIKRNEVWLAAILGAVAGAVAGSAATVLAERLVHKWWP
jgi:hypothetical protein